MPHNCKEGFSCPFHKIMTVFETKRLAEDINKGHRKTATKRDQYQKFTECQEENWKSEEQKLHFLLSNFCYF